MAEVTTQPVPAPTTSGPSFQGALDKQGVLNEEALVMNVAMARMQAILNIIGKISGR